GCELAQAFARLGVEVVLIESEPRVLPKEDPRASALVAQALDEAGVVIEVGASVVAVERRGAHVSIEIERQDGVEEIAVDELLVAAGRRPNTDELNLAAAGVELDA